MSSFVENMHESMSWLTRGRGSTIANPLSPVIIVLITTSKRLQYPSGNPIPATNEEMDLDNDVDMDGSAPASFEGNI